jgi:hypothetical protein
VKTKSHDDNKIIDINYEQKDGDGDEDESPIRDK